MTHLQRQRQIDRCLYPILQKRCLILSQISASNDLLKKIIRALAILETTQTAAVIIPGAQGALSVALGASAEAARGTARALATAQDAMVALEKVNALRALSCGFTTTPTSALRFSRKKTLQALIAKTVSPLSWPQTLASTQLELWRWDLKAQSYGHCASVPHEKQTALNGETYEPSFRRPDKPLLKRWSFF